MAKIADSIFPIVFSFMFCFCLSIAASICFVSSTANAAQNTVTTTNTADKNEQTNNIGMFSGGAPYLIIVILGLLNLIKHKNNLQANLEIKEQEQVIILLERLLKQHGESEAKIAQIKNLKK
jgi:glycerol-3-phosphate acyltransferase PlsY